MSEPKKTMYAVAVLAWKEKSTEPVIEEESNREGWKSLVEFIKDYRPEYLAGKSYPKFTEEWLAQVEYTAFTSFFCQLPAT